jgi:serine/threonine-protein phosphatase 2B catalytic subunit
MAARTQLERAIKQIQGRGPAPDIDFTQHQLENGYIVSTQERVVKEVLSPAPLDLVYPCL